MAALISHQRNVTAAISLMYGFCVAREDLLDPSSVAIHTGSVQRTLKVHLAPRLLHLRVAGSKHTIAGMLVAGHISYRPRDRVNIADNMLKLALGKEQSLSLSLAPAVSVSCVVSPVVLLMIVEHFARRHENQQGVNGALLGTRSEDGSTLYIRNAFPIPYSEESNINIDENVAKSLLSLHRRANAKETVLGCYSTGSELTSASARLHEWFESTMVSTANSFFNSIHMLLNCELMDDSFGLKTFIGLPVGPVVSGSKGRMFVPAPTKIKFHDAERSGLEVISQAAHSANHIATHTPNELESVESALTHLIDIVDALSAHIDTTVERLETNNPQVSAEERKRFDSIGQALADAVGQVPNLDKSMLDGLLDRHFKDLKMVVQLATLTKDQMVLSTRLMTSLAV